MNALTIAITSVVLSLTALAQVPPEQQAQEELSLGTKAYKSANYEAAIEHFHRAELLDPSLCKAKLYLATHMPKTMCRVWIRKTMWRLRRNQSTVIRPHSNVIRAASTR